MSTARITPAILAVVLLMAGVESQAQTVVGPLNAVTGIDGLMLADGSNTYDFNVVFLTGSYSSVYAGDDVPTFEGNPSQASAAALAIANVFNSAGVTNVAGATSNPSVTSLSLAVPYGFGDLGWIGQGANTGHIGVPGIWVDGSVSGTFNADASVGVIYTGFYLPFSTSPLPGVPEPASAWLLLSALGLGLLARKPEASRFLVPWSLLKT
jgi:hypothetical protein